MISGWKEGMNEMREEIKDKEIKRIVNGVGTC